MSPLTPSSEQLNANANVAAIAIAKRADNRALANSREIEVFKTDQTAINVGVMNELKAIRKMLEDDLFSRPWVRRSVKGAVWSLQLCAYFLATYLALRNHH